MRQTKRVMTNANRDSKYRELLLDPIRKCAHYLPKMGGGEEVSFKRFQTLYGADPLYHWMGLDTQPMFAAHRAAGGMTSVYRQLGIGCERLFRQVLRDQMGLSTDQVKWSYDALVATNDSRHKYKRLTLDGRLEMADVQNAPKRKRVQAWVDDQRAKLRISAQLKGAVFEVRQGYKSADSKRQNGDIANATQALGDGYLPVLVLMSTQINKVVYERYLLNNWAVLLGTADSEDSLQSTFGFSNMILGYDLAAFFERNTAELRGEVTAILNQLLAAE